MTANSGHGSTDQTRGRHRDPLASDPQVSGGTADLGLVPLGARGGVRELAVPRVNADLNTFWSERLAVDRSRGWGLTSEAVRLGGR